MKGFRLTEESFAGGLVVADILVQHLQRDDIAINDVARSPHGAHASASDLSEKLISLGDNLSGSVRVPTHRPPRHYFGTELQQLDLGPV